MRLKKRNLVIRSNNEKESDMSKFDFVSLVLLFVSHSFLFSMGGKGRTGTVIACYLLYCGIFDQPAKALSYFAERRSKIKKGVIQPSQLRYVGYFGQILREMKLPDVNEILLKKITFNGVPLFSKTREGCKPIVKVYNVSQVKRTFFKRRN